MKKILLPILMIIISFMLFGCEEEKVDIYTTVYPLTFFTEQIVGDKLNVKSAYPSNAEVHDYEPTAKTLIKMSEAKMIIYIGLGLEPFIEKGISTTFANVKCLKVSSCKSLLLVTKDGLTSNSPHTTSDTAYDPHIWLDPFQMQHVVQHILDSLLEIDEFKEYSEEFTHNAEDLKTRLDELATRFDSKLSETKKKTIIVDHDAYAYWSYRYQFDRMSLRSDNESSDPNAKVFSEIVDYALEHNLKYLIVTENEAQQSLVSQYINTLNKNNPNLNPSILYLNNLEIQTEKMKDYFTVMENNLDVLIKALNNY